MRIVMFYHSLLSDWNHGNAHFLRGVARELLALGHDVRVFEPDGGWSLRNLLEDHGAPALEQFRHRYPELTAYVYDPNDAAVEAMIEGADLVIVHEWNPPALVARIGRAARDQRVVALFHDTHHRAVTAPAEMEAFDLSGYDGVLAFGDVLRRLYLHRGWTTHAWTWHEAADARLCRPLPEIERTGDLVWIGNWGDEERTVELHEFLLAPVSRLRLAATVYGVRYPPHARRALERTGIHYRGWLPNFEAPRAYAEHRVTVHVPRRPYTRALPGIPTIRVFEALACGIPLVCAPWSDTEGLFEPGRDYLIANDGEDMDRQLKRLLQEPEQAAALAAHGRQTVLERHTCAHRARELLQIAATLGARTAPTEVAS
jgi:spore maturation protein CgeB